MLSRPSMGIVHHLEERSQRTDVAKAFPVLGPAQANLGVPAHLSFDNPLLERGQLAESELTPIGLANLPLALGSRQRRGRDGHRFRRAARARSHLTRLQGHG